MKPAFNIPSFFKASQKDLSRILVHLADPGESSSVVSNALRLGIQKRAHLRGLTIVDTSRLLRDLASEGSAVSAAYESERLSAGEAQREESRMNFSTGCLAASLDFDLCRRQGDVATILQAESRFHDLLITSTPAGRSPGIDEISTPDVAKIIRTSHCPTLVLRDSTCELGRVLLVHDGSKACSRAIASFRAQRLLPEATVRLLAVGDSQESAKALLAEQLDLILPDRANFEHGYLAGKASKLVPEYAKNWEADLVVYGVSEKSSIVESLLRQASLRVLDQTSASLYSA